MNNPAPERERIIAWHGPARQGRAWLGGARPGAAWRGKAWITQILNK